MKTLNRLRTTISASFENFVSQVENQEAIVNHLTTEVKEAFAEVKIKIKETQRMIDANEKRVDQIEKDILKWQNFYYELSQEDPDQAKKVIKKIIHLKDEQKNAKKNIIELDKTLNSLNQEKYLIEDKLREIHTRKATLVAKESKIKTNQVVSEQGRLNDNIEDIFNRWENKLIKVETTTDIHTSELNDNNDSLEDLLNEKELQKRIEAEILLISKDK